MFVQIINTILDAIKTYDSNNEKDDNFCHVPEDVIRSIFKASEISSLGSLSLVSKKFHQITKDELSFIIQVLKVAKIHFKGDCHLNNIRKYAQELKARVLYCLEKHENLNLLKSEIDKLFDRDQIESWVTLKKIVDLSDALIFWNCLKKGLNEPLTTLQFQTIEELLNREKDYQEWFQKNENLLLTIRDIKLDNKNLTSLPETIAACKNLDHLNIDKNHLTSLPETIGQCENLKLLDLKSNNLKSLIESIGSLRGLEKLNLNNNYLTSLPKSIGQCIKLKTLSINNNKLTALPEMVGQCKNLEWLSIKHNKLISLPESFGQLKNLIYFNLDYNQFKELPDFIGEFKNLKTLIISNNKITSLPKSIYQCTKLNIINLKINLIIEQMQREALIDQDKCVLF